MMQYDLRIKVEFYRLERNLHHYCHCHHSRIDFQDQPFPCNRKIKEYFLPAFVVSFVSNDQYRYIEFERNCKWRRLNLLTKMLISEVFVSLYHFWDIIRFQTFAFFN